MTTRPKLIVDDSLPYLSTTLSRYTDALFLPSQEITQEAIRKHQAQGLLIRSVCQCNSELLEKTTIRFIATATAGTDHIDSDYCKAHHIVVKNAPGCNAPAVAQYLFGALARSSLKKKKSLSGMSLGIVGVGHVGKEVLRYAKAIGMKTYLCDPIRAEVEETNDFCSLEELLSQSDLISFHVPLTHHGKYPTFHLLNTDSLAFVKQGAIIINAARGAVVDTKALLKAKETKKISAMIIDCWEGEPKISPQLLQEAFIATPHIAGFSAESKARGSRTIAEEMAHFFNIGIDCSEITPPKEEGLVIEASLYGDWTIEKCLEKAINLETIENKLRRNPSSFESLRVGYTFHREPTTYEVTQAESRFIQPLQQIGFRCL